MPTPDHDATAGAAPASAAPAPAPRSLASSGIRFVLAGGLNTLLTGLALSFLARVIDPRIAYTVVFAAGIVLAVALAGGFVFGVPLTRRLAILYGGMYVVVYLIGLGAVALAVRAGLPDVWSGAVVVITAPLTFLGGRALLTSDRLRRTTPERTA